MGSITATAHTVLEDERPCAGLGVAAHDPAMSALIWRFCCLWVLFVGVSLSTTAQSRRDSSNAFHRRFSIGVGFALPYPETEKLYTSYTANMTPTSIYGLDDLWRNVFTNQSVLGLHSEVYPVRIGYSPNDRIEFSLGYYSRRSEALEVAPDRYAMRMTRLFGNALFRPAVKFSKRFRPVIGFSLAYDERGHEQAKDAYVGMLYFNCTTKSGMASVVAGTQMAAGRFLFGLELNLTLLAYSEIRYADNWSTGVIKHWMSPLEAFNTRFMYGPITLHANYTFR